MFHIPAVEDIGKSEIEIKHAMTLNLTTIEKLARARADLRMGAGIVVANADSAALVFAAETVNEARFDDIRARGEPVLALTARRAETLRLRAYDGDLARVVFPSGADLSWVRAMADPAADMMSPMKAPCQTMRDGPSDVHRFALGLCKQAQLLPAALVLSLTSDAAEFAAQYGLVYLDLSADGVFAHSALHKVSSARVPLEVSTAGRVHVFRPEDGGEEHYAIEIGQPDRGAPVLSRLHSACFTGDLLGSLKCDCGAQLKAAMAQIGAEGAGVLLYLNQEGRGIGLANKMRAYALQDQGFDTVEANHRLGFEDDERNFALGAEILRAMGFQATRLMTNNPSKVEMMQKAGLEVVERVPLQVGRNAHNTEYLDTKAAKSGHIL